MNPDDGDGLDARLGRWMAVEAQAEPYPLRALPGTFRRTRPVRQVAGGRVWRPLRPPTLAVLLVAVLAIAVIAAPFILRSPAVVGGQGPGPSASTAAEVSPAPSTTSEPIPKPFDFKTEVVSFEAQEFSITAASKVFRPLGSISVHSDLGTPAYETLELIWHDAGIEMRLNIYFKADHAKWWSEEIRTYDGNSPGDWITYTGHYFEAPLGETFRGNLDLQSGADSLRIQGLDLQAFTGPNVVEATSCGEGNWPTMPVSCEAALAASRGNIGQVDLPRIWLTTLSAVHAGFHSPIVPGEPQGDTPVWVLLYVTGPLAQNALRVVDATRPGAGFIELQYTNEGDVPLLPALLLPATAASPILQPSPSEAPVRAEQGPVPSTTPGSSGGLTNQIISATATDVVSPVCGTNGCSAVDFVVAYTYSGSPAGPYVGVRVLPSTADGVNIEDVHQDGVETGYFGYVPPPLLSAGSGTASVRVVWSGHTSGSPATTTEFVRVCLYANDGNGSWPEFGCVVLPFHHVWVANVTR